MTDTQCPAIAVLTGLALDRNAIVNRLLSASYADESTAKRGLRQHLKLIAEVDARIDSILKKV